MDSGEETRDSSGDAGGDMAGMSSIIAAAVSLGYNSKWGLLLLPNYFCIFEPSGSFFPPLGVLLVVVVGVVVGV